MPIQPGINIGRYHILEQLGEGGMAVVFRAFDTHLDCDMAIKVIRLDNLPVNRLEKTLLRFQSEAKRTARLTHSNIVKVVDNGEYQGTPYLVMPYIPGGTLKDRMGKPIPWEEAVKLIMPIAEALDYAHSKGVIHRDVKPSNVLITESGTLMLSDFGIAKILDEEETREFTTTGVGIGTPEYMSPEQALSGEIDARSDIYSLGIVLFELVTGRKPFQASTPMAVLIKQARDSLPRVSEIVPGFSERAEQVLIKALAKEPDNRYQSMRSFIDGIFTNHKEEINNSKILSNNNNDQKYFYNNQKPEKNHYEIQNEKKHSEKKKEIIYKDPAKDKFDLFKKKNLIWIGFLILIISVTTLIFNSDLEKPNPISEISAFPATKMPTPTKVSTVTPTSTPLPIGTEVLNPGNAPRIKKLYDLNLSGVTKILKSTFLNNTDEVVSLGSDGIIYFWDYRNGEINTKIPTNLDDIWDIDISEVSDQIAVITTNGDFRIWRISNKDLIYDNDFTQGEILSVSINPNGKTAIVGTYRPNGMYSVDLENSDAEFELIASSKNEILAIEFSNDGNVFMAGTDYNLIKLFDSGSNENIRILRGHKGWIRDLEFSPDGKQLASASADNTVKLWDTDNGVLRKSLEGHEHWAMRVDYSPDGDLIVSTSEDGKVRVWDSKTGELLSTIWSNVELEPGYLYDTDAVFSPDGKFLIVDLSEDATVEVWGLGN